MCCGSNNVEEAVSRPVERRLPVLPGPVVQNTVLPSPAALVQLLPAPPSNIEERAQPVADFDLEGGEREVAIGNCETATCLFSKDFSPCIPVVVFRANPAHTSFMHVFSSLQPAHLRQVLAADPRPPQMLVVVGRDPNVARDGWAQKARYGRRSFETVAREFPDVRFVWAEVSSNSTMHARVDGTTRTIQVSHRSPQDPRNG